MKKANNVKRIKTISAIKKKPRLESESDVSSKEQENTVNITINNNIPKKNKSKHYSKYTYIRHKTAYFEGRLHLETHQPKLHHNGCKAFLHRHAL